MYSNLISPTSYDNLTSSSKENLLNDLTPLSRSMCKGLAVGEDPGVAVNHLVTITTGYFLYILFYLIDYLFFFF